MEKISILIIVSLVLLIVSLIAFLVYRGKLPGMIKHQNKIQIFLLLVILGQIVTTFAVSSKPILDENKKVDEEKVFKAVEDRIKLQYPDKVYDPGKVKEGKVKPEFTKQSAVDTLKEIFEEVKGKDNVEKLKERVKQLEEKADGYKDEALFPQNVLARVYLPDTMKNDNVYANTATALTALAGLLEERTKGINVVSLDMASLVLDKSTNTVFVPLDIFIGNFTGITLQMVFIDGEWRLMPYTLMIQAQTTLAQQQAAQK